MPMEYGSQFINRFSLFFTLHVLNVKTRLFIWRISTFLVIKMIGVTGKIKD